MSAEHLRAAEAILAGRNAARILAAMAPQQPNALLRTRLTTGRKRNVELTLMVTDLAGSFAFLDDEAERDIRKCRLRLIAHTGTVHRRWSTLTDYPPNSLWDIDRVLPSGAIVVDIVVAELCGKGNPGFAEFVDGLRVASGGGQSDFVRGAHVSDGGASVIALPARPQPHRDAAERDRDIARPGHRLRRDRAWHRKLARPERAREGRRHYRCRASRRTTTTASAETSTPARKAI